jgi:hypothetical protein
MKTLQFIFINNVVCRNPFDGYYINEFLNEITAHDELFSLPLFLINTLLKKEFAQRLGTYQFLVLV